MNCLLDKTLFTDDLHSYVKQTKLFQLRKLGALCVALGVVSCVTEAMAENVEIQKQNEKSFYVGFGMSIQQRKHDFDFSSVPDGLDYYYHIGINRKKVSYVPLIALGYQIQSPVYGAIELSYIFNKRDEKRFFAANGSAYSPYTNNAVEITSKKGNTFQLALKLGKTFENRITPYFIAGISSSSVGYNVSYPYGGVNDYSEANSSKNKNKIGFLYGIGASLRLKGGFDIKVEITQKHTGNVTVNAPCFPRDLDTDGYSRTYKIRGKNETSLSVLFSKNFNFL